MTLADWIAVLGYAAMATALGYGALRLFRTGTGPLTDEWPACFLAGQLVLLLATLATIVVPVTHTELLPLLVAASALAALWWARDRIARRQPPRLTPALPMLATCALALLLFPNLVMSAHTTPIVDWDARSIWMLHGKALYLRGAVDPSFFGNEQFWWSNLDYPLLQPAQAAWSSLLIGRWSDIGCKAFLLIQFVAWFRLLVAKLTARGLPLLLSVLATAAIVAQGQYLITYGFWFVSGGADSHYATPLLLAGLALSMRAAAGQVPFAILMLTYAANVKNEAAAFVAVFALACTALWAWRHRRALGSSLRGQLHWRGPAAFAVVFGVVPIVTWKLFAAAQHLPGGLHLMAQVPELPARLWEHTPTVLRAFAATYASAGSHWLVLAWVALGVVGFARHRTLGLGRRDATVALLLVATNALIFATFVLTPHDVVIHMAMALARLLRLPQLLLCLLCVLQLDRAMAARA